MNMTDIKNVKEIRGEDGADARLFCLSATIDGIQMSVPLDPANRHYAEIVRQVELGLLTIQDATV